MKKKPFSFFLELLFVLFFFLITSTILIEIYAKMMQVSKEDTYRQEAMIIAQNEIETHTRVGDYTRKMNDTDYDIKIKRINDNEFRIQIYVKETKVLDYDYYQEGTSNETVKNRIRCRYNAKYICRCMYVCFSVVFSKQSLSNA